MLIPNGEAMPREIAVGEMGVYFTAGLPKDGRIERVSHDGKTRTHLASGQLSAHGITLDAHNVYWSAWGGGSLWRIAKPVAP